MFHHQPYSTQEPLAMSQADVAVVVEVVCGAGAARVFAGADPKPGQGWEDAFDQGSLGQVGGRVWVGNRGRAVSLPACVCGWG